VNEAGSEYEKISPTALGVAYCRALTDIPFSKELFEQLISVSDVEPRQFETMRSLTPMFEARFKLTDRILNEEAAVQVLELAAGFSPRGLAFKGSAYVEVDLPGVMAIKRKLVGAIGSRANLFIEDGNVLETEAMERVSSHFSPGALFVVNEGLLRYLNFEEKAAVARNVHDLLKKRGGAWITPDITVLRERPTNEISDLTKEIGKSIGRDLKEQAFENEKAAVHFFRELGFSVQSRSFGEVEAELVSLKSIPVSAEERAFCLDRQAFILKPL